MRKKYARPSIELVKHLPEVSILEGSSGDGTWAPPGGGAVSVLVKMDQIALVPSRTNSLLGKTGMSINP